MSSMPGPTEQRVSIACDLMFVVSSYTRFLKFHERFRNALLKKLFEFMANNEILQTAACTALLRLSGACAKSSRNGRLRYLICKMF